MKKINTLYFLVVIVLGACSNNSENASGLSDSSKSGTKDTMPSKNFTHPDTLYAWYDAVVVQDTKLQSDSSQMAYGDSMLYAGDQIKIIGQTKLAQLDLDDPDSTSCEFGYFYYRVKTMDNKIGWVYGNRIAQKSKAYKGGNSGSLEALQKHSGEEVMQGTTAYYFDAGIKLLKEPEDGIGCDVQYFPFFYDKTGKIYLIKARQDLFVSKDWLVQTKDDLLVMILNSEGGGVTITNIVKEAMGTKDPQFQCEHSYQDGGASSTIYLKLSGDHFDVSKYEFRKDKN